MKDVKRATLLASDDEIASLLDGVFARPQDDLHLRFDNLLKKINKETGRILSTVRADGVRIRWRRRKRQDGKLPLPAVGQGTAQQFPRKSDGLYAELLDDEREEVEAYFAEEIAKADAKFKQREKAADATLPIPVSTEDGPS